MHSLVEIHEEIVNVPAEAITFCVMHVSDVEDKQCVVELVTVCELGEVKLDPQLLVRLRWAWHGFIKRHVGPSR